MFVVEERKAQDRNTSLVAQQKFVTSGPTRGDQVAILSGIKEGDVVVTAGQIKLRPGIPVIVNNSIRHSSNRASLNKPWVSDSGAYEFKVDLAAPAQGRQLSVAVKVPRTVVFEQVQRSIKNFAALFIASIFLSGVFLRVAVSLRGADRLRLPAAPAKDGASGEIALILLKLLFLGVFLDSLTYAFLPRFMQEAATSSGLTVSFASVPFTAYYLLFALSLIPAGNLADRYGPNPVIVAGLILAGASVLGLALPVGIYEMTALRALAGVGQGMLLIGVQNYILSVASPDKKTQGTAIIVLGFQGGMLSGMAIGSLLVNSLYPQGVFMVAGAVGAVATLYTLLLLPRIAGNDQIVGGLRGTVQRLATDCKNVITDGQFLKTIFCIGIPAKALLTGVISFAIPLILTQQHYLAEDIGQLVMLYGLGVVASTGIVSRMVIANATQFGNPLRRHHERPGLDAGGLMGAKIIGEGQLSTVVAIGHRSCRRRSRVHQRTRCDPCGHLRTGGADRRCSGHDDLSLLERAGHISGLLVSQLFRYGARVHILSGGSAFSSRCGAAFAMQIIDPVWPRWRPEMMAAIGVLRSFSSVWIIALMLFCAGLPASAQDKPFSKWFRYGAEVDAAWQVAGGSNPLQVSIRRKGTKEGTAVKRVMVLYPRASSAYDTEITRILRVFDDKEVNAEFTVINFELVDSAGKAALQLAEARKFNLIFAMGSEATAWLYDNYRGGALPVVSVCSKDPVQLNQMTDYERGSGTNFAYTSLNVQVEVQMSYLGDMIPD